MEEGLARLRISRDQEREATKQAAAAAIGKLSERELFMTGVALYWAEGAKDKPYRRTEVLQFINSDPNVIKLFLRRLDLLGVTRDRLTVRVSIHETANVTAAEEFWAETTGIKRSAFSNAHPEETQPPDGAKEHGELSPWLPDDLRPTERRPVPSHGGRLVRHSRGRTRE